MTGPVRPRLRPADAADAAVILALNARSEALTSPMDEARLAHLAELSALLLVAEIAQTVQGFVMAFTADSAYESPNYRWFDGRLRRFLYVDRIVISESLRGAGLGQAFYAQLFEVARRDGLAWLAAEMNLVPANTRSLRFHAAAGFMEVGRQTLPGGKLLSMQICPTARAED